MADQLAEPLLKRNKASSTLHETIEKCIGEFGWAQLLQAILVSLAWVFDAQQTFISVFTDTSIVSEWSGSSSGSVLTSLPTSSFFVGCLVGGFLLSTLADSSLGRKKTLVLSCLIMSVSGAITSLSTDIWMYSFLRFLTGFGRATIGTCALVLSTELVGSQWRGHIGILGFLCSTLGFLSLPAIAFVNKGSSWRALYLWTCLPTILYSILVHFFVFESPRWLYVRGNKEEFVLTLKSITTRSSLNLSFFGSFFEFEDQEQKSPETVNLYSAIKMLVEKDWAWRRVILVMVAGFGIGMVYYGMPLGVGNLPFNLYLSVTLNALSELPASLVPFLLIGKLNRKGLLLGFVLLSGVSSIGCVIVQDDHLKGLQMGFELVSFFGACTSFNVLLIYTVELFPTCVRNSAVAMVRQALVLGGVFCPILVALGRDNRWFSYGVFGMSIASSGLFVLCLPETKGRTLCDTMDEEEHKEIVFVC